MLKDCAHPTGRWQRAPGDERVDAALLLSVIRGAAGPDDPRVRATVQAVMDELGDDGLVYRFRQDARPLHQAEGAFLLSGLWMALAAHALGDETGAARWFERNRGACGRPVSTPRNTTCTSASSAATSPRPSCTPRSWKLPSGCPVPPVAAASQPDRIR